MRRCAGCGKETDYRLCEKCSSDPVLKEMISSRDTWRFLVWIAVIAALSWLIGGFLTGF